MLPSHSANTKRSELWGASWRRLRTLEQPWKKHLSWTTNTQSTALWGWHSSGTSWTSWGWGCSTTWNSRSKLGTAWPSCGLKCLTGGGGKTGATAARACSQPCVVCAKQSPCSDQWMHWAGASLPPPSSLWRVKWAVLEWLPLAKSNGGILVEWFILWNTCVQVFPHRVCSCWTQSTTAQELLISFATSFSGTPLESPRRHWRSSAWCSSESLGTHARGRLGRYFWLMDGSCVQDPFVAPLLSAPLCAELLHSVPEGNSLQPVLLAVPRHSSWEYNWGGFGGGGGIFK